MAETAQPVVSLKNLLVTSKSYQVEYPGLAGFKLDLRYLSRETLLKIRKKATRSTFKNRTPIEELDDQLFLQLYVNESIKGWSGLKYKYVEQLAPVDLGGMDTELELPYTEENALMLMKESPDFDAFISETVTVLSNFNKRSTNS